MGVGDRQPDRHGARWKEIDEGVRTSYSLVAPKRLAKQVFEHDRSAIR